MISDNRKRVLIIEDESHIAEGLKLNLELQNYYVEIAADGMEGLSMWKQWQPDLIVLDIMLPGIDGLSVLRNIRLDDNRIPILILSAKNTADDKIKGLKYGVDDYLAKPFILEEFLLRVERLMDRGSWVQSEEDSLIKNPSSLENLYSFGANSIDFNTGIANCKKGEINLTGQEIKLLKLFFANKGKPLSRKKLLEIGWGYTKNMTTRTVDNFMVRIRKYFEDNPKKPVYFQSKRSVGYIFDNKKDSNKSEDQTLQK